MSQQLSYSSVLLAANAHHSYIEAHAALLQAALGKLGIKVELWRGQDSVSCLDGIDLILVLGGDGYMMSVVRALAYPDIPFHGLNYGRVGFLMNPPAEPDVVASRIAEGNFHTTEHPVLKGKLTQAPGQSAAVRAFNDIVIERASGQTVHLQMFIDDVWLNQYSGDGLIVSTPGGSTAYSLAAGGPVVHHDVQAMLVTPLNPHRPVRFHSLQFPVILPVNSRIQIVVEDIHKRPVRCTADGISIEDVTEITITCSNKKTKLLRAPEYNYVQTLVEKIMGMGTPPKS